MLANNLKKITYPFTLETGKGSQNVGGLGE